MENRFKKIREDFEFTKNGYRMTAKGLAEIFKSKGYDSLDHTAIRKIETNNRKVYENELKGYIEVFNTTSDYLLGFVNTPSVNVDEQVISKNTGLSGNSISIMKEMSEKEKIIVNALIERGDILLLQHAIENYYRRSFQTINIVGLGEERKFSNDESEKIFQHLSTDYINDIFNHLVHDKEITNVFTRNAFNKYYDALEDVTNQASMQFEQTPERKDYDSQNKDYFAKLRAENEATDYYSLYNKNKKERK